MPRQTLSDLALVLLFLRQGQGWSQAQLGEAAAISPNLLNDYEHGRKELTRGRLEHLAAVLGLPPDAIDGTLACLEANRAASRLATDPVDPFAASRREVEAVAVRVGRLATGFARSALTLLTVEGEALTARQRAETLWRQLKQRQPAERRLLVEHSRKFRGWALAERLAAESIAAAPNHPAQALELAELALRLAELAPGEESWRRRLQGYAWAHVSNARRVSSDLPGADQALSRARKLWDQDSAGDPGLLDAAVVPWIEAALRRDQRRFGEALARVDEALACDQGRLRAQILLTKARVHETLGDPESSTAALAAAAPLIDAQKEPRLALVLRFNLLLDLCHLDRAAEAESQLAAVRALAERLGEQLDLLHVVWLEGKVAFGLGRTAEARRSFEQVRRELTARDLAFDCALVSLDLALVLLGLNRTSEVRTLAGEMLWIFSAQGVHREALAALRVFCDAASREAATVDLARHILLYLYRARYDPDLAFELGGGGGAEAGQGSGP